ncbi:AAA family ATPase [Sphingorhabdus sp.]|uniref:AAA family ATPase n=1 Tax=Sphingorhabdus sp. TaxID=1902408 RepID=UPI00333E1B6A
MALDKDIKELVCAGFSGIWVETLECDDAIASIRKMTEANKWSFELWDIDRQLYSGVTPAPSPLHPLKYLTQLAETTPPNSPPMVMVLKNFHRFLANPEVLQTLANRAALGKGIGQYIVIVSPVLQLQPEIEKLFTVVHHDLPDTAQLTKTCNDLVNDDPAFSKPTEAEVQAVVDASRGLTRQEAENAYALSFVRNKKLSADVIWSIKAQTLEKSGTMTLYRGDANFQNLGGLENLKQFCLRAMRRQGETNVDKRPKGVLLLSPPGCGKSQFAKALGNEVGRPTVMLDFGSLMGKFVGESEGNMRRALKQVDAMAPCVLFVDEIEKGLAGVSNGGANDSGVGARLFGTLLTWLNDHTSDVFFIGTCNDASQLPAPFARAERFDGIFFVDLPGDEQRAAIWDIYLDQFGVDKTQERPDDSNWTGAEIKSCCRLASLLDVPLIEAAQNVVPVSVTSAEQIESLRNWAAGRCLAADNKGIYTRVGKAVTQKAGRRKLTDIVSGINN